MPYRGYCIHFPDCGLIKDLCTYDWKLQHYAIEKQDNVTSGNHIALILRTEIKTISIHRI